MIDGPRDSTPLHFDSSARRSTTSNSIGMARQKQYVTMGASSNQSADPSHKEEAAGRQVENGAASPYILNPNQHTNGTRLNWKRSAER